MPSNDVFILYNKLMEIEESKTEGKAYMASKALLRVTAKPLVYNSENISVQQVLALGDHELKV